MVKTHLVGILNAVVTGVTNAMSEGGINAAIQRIKYNARGIATAPTSASPSTSISVDSTSTRPMRRPHDFLMRQKKA